MLSVLGMHLHIKDTVLNSTILKVCTVSHIQKNSETALTPCVHGVNEYESNVIISVYESSTLLRTLIQDVPKYVNHVV